MILEIFYIVFLILLCFMGILFLGVMVLFVQSWYSDRRAKKDFEERQERYRRMI